ncbi:MAG: reverse transcriptase/maturase family protein [Candidatus Cloacimonetes bacterium]|nr:reverse transcriptase/maturase family protein [Candidatus Cloacimonadota bacterium]
MKIADIENLWLAHENARKGKGWYREVRAVDGARDQYLENLRTMLILGKYITSPYVQQERRCGSKIRQIYKLPYYPDRIVHHAILQITLPIFVKNLIADTYACVPGRGIHSCAKKLSRVLRTAPDARYCLKMDIKKFYPSVNHDILKSLVRRLIKCKPTLALIDEIIESAESGLPIGNYLSQHLANLYLSGFDHWLKEEKRIKHYYRYCDDLVILGSDKDELHKLRKEIVSFLLRKLKLSVNNNWQVFPISIRGIDFLGYRFFSGYTLLRKSIALNFKRKMKLIASGKMSAKAVVSSFVSYYGWLCHANTLRLRRKHITDGVKNKIINSCKELKCKNPMYKMTM